MWWLLIPVGVFLVARAQQGAPTSGPVAAARRQLTLDFGIPDGRIRVRRSVAHTFPDASLGLPEPGMVYAQQTTPGFLVELEVDGKVAEYHCDQQARCRFCPPCSARLSAGAW